MNKQMAFSKKIFKSGPNAFDIKALESILFSSINLANEEEREVFFSPSLENLHDPALMADMTEAVEHINTHIENKNRIIVYGDFDTDGITSTAILADALKTLGGKVSTRIPDRVKHSHGLHHEIIDEIAQTGSKLILTCDCGINDKEVVEYALSKEINVIITDHHLPDPAKKTRAHQVINPLQTHCTYPDKTLSGAGIAFKLIQAMAQKNLPQESQKGFLEKYLELAAIGLIADCVPLKGESRTIVKLGIEKLKSSQWDSLKIILETQEFIDEQSISFNIAPRLNAASRLSTAQHSLDFFLAKQQHVERIDFLNNLNNKRKQRTEDITTEALEKMDNEPPFILVKNDTWETGIVGLVASRLSEKFHKPSFVGTKSTENFWNFSARSPEGISAIEMLRSAGEIFERIGGHSGAAGFSIEEDQIPKLEKALSAYAVKNPLGPKELASDVIITSEVLSLELAHFIEPLKPFGIGNPEPIFEIKNARVLEIQPLGSTNQHHKITFEDSYGVFEVIAFFKPELKEILMPEMEINIFFTIAINAFKGEKKLQLKLVDLNLSI